MQVVKAVSLAEPIRRAAIHAAETQREKYRQDDRPSVGHHREPLGFRVLVTAFLMHDRPMAEWAGQRSGEKKGKKSSDAKNAKSDQGGNPALVVI